MLHQRRGTSTSGQSGGSSGGLSIATGGDYSYGGGGYGNGGGYTGYPPPNTTSSTNFAASAARRPQDSSKLHRRPPGEEPWWRRYVVYMLLVGLLMVSMITSRVSYGRLQKKYKDIVDQHSKTHSTLQQKHESRNAEMYRELTDLRRKVSQLETEKETLTQQHHEATAQLGEHQDMHESLTYELDYNTAQGEEIKKNFKFLTDYIQRESHREVLERFGPGPHRVKVTLEFFHDVSYPGSGLVTPHVPERYFVVELAPISLMPHAVHLFLEQVEHKLWDGCAFVLNAGHVLQASPVAPNYMQRGATEHIDKITPFKRARLEKLGYSEFTPEYHHTRWTIGFAGRPSGPDWYINLDDNSLSHGPGMQEHHALTEDADPCFGKVIEGFDVVEEMKKQETANGVFVQYIHIKSAVILKEPSTSTISTGPGKVNDPSMGQGATATAGGGSALHDGIPSDINLPKNFAQDSKVQVENVHMTAHARGV